MRQQLQQDESGQTEDDAGNREQVEKSFYRAFTSMLSSTSTFYLARVATLQSARDLYGAGSSAERAIAAAWDAVGVSSPGAALTTTFTPRSVPVSPVACGGVRCSCGAWRRGADRAVAPAAA